MLIMLWNLRLQLCSLGTDIFLFAIAWATILGAFKRLVFGMQHCLTPKFGKCKNHRVTWPLKSQSKSYKYKQKHKYKHKHKYKPLTEAFSLVISYFQFVACVSVSVCYFYLCHSHTKQIFLFRLFNHDSRGWTWFVWIYPFQPPNHRTTDPPPQWAISVGHTTCIRN